MNARLVLVLILANLRNMRASLVGIMFAGVLVAVWIPASLLKPPDATGFRVALSESDLPEIKEALEAVGFRTAMLDPANGAGTLQVDASLVVSEPGKGLPRRVRITYPDATGNATLDIRLREALLSASQAYGRRLSREAGLGPDAALPIRIDKTSEGTMAKVVPVIAGLFDSARFVPPVTLAACMGLGLFGILPVLFEALHVPRGAGRLEILFPIRLSPLDFTVSLVGTQVVVSLLYTGLVACLTHAVAYGAGLTYKPGYAEALVAAPVVSACVCPFVIAASTLFRTATLSLFAAMVTGALVGGIAYVPTLGTALGMPEATFAVWPIKGLLQGPISDQAASLAVTACIGAVGFALACRRLDGRTLVRRDA